MNQSQKQEQWNKTDLCFWFWLLFASSTLAWRIPWTEEPGRLQSMGLLRVRHDWATSLSLFTFIHWRRKWQPTQVFLPGESHRRRSLVGCSPWGCSESDMTERLHFHFSLSYIGEENGNPLQCSCLENPRDGGAWWAAIYGVTHSWTWLKRLSSSSSMRVLWKCPGFATGHLAKNVTSLTLSVLTRRQDESDNGDQDDGRGSWSSHIHIYSGPLLQSRCQGLEPSHTLVRSCNKIPWPAALEAMLMPIFGIPCTSY